MMSPRVTQMSPAVRRRSEAGCAASAARSGSGRRRRVASRGSPRLRRSLPRSRRAASVSPSSPNSSARMPRHSRDPVSSWRVAIASSFPAIGVGDPEPGQRPHFALLHRLRPARRRHGRSRAGAGCRGRRDARHDRSSEIAFSSASRAQTPWARTTSPSISSGPSPPHRRARRAPSAGRTGRWSACPCRARWR